MKPQNLFHTKKKKKHQIFQHNEFYDVFSLKYKDYYNFFIVMRLQR